MKCGLLGRSLGHSYSPQIHAMLGSYSYELFEKEPEEVGEFVRHGDYNAMNVTIPYKKDVIPYLDQIDDTARRLGAVNTIVRQSDGTIKGYNTDYYGFIVMVQRSGIEVSGKKVLVLGSGGASVTAQAALADLGAQVVVISRAGENNYGNLHLHRDAQIIVNTTPIGMYPANGATLMDLRAFPLLEGVLDVIYNPSSTQLLMDAEELWLSCENGLWMLVAQAKQASEYFTGRKLPDSIISSIHFRLENQMRNIVLIGMPGCGKSTIGKALAQRTGKTFADADETVAQIGGMSIPEIFAQRGEEVFREYETLALMQLGKGSGQVIATGGGCVTRQRNYSLLHQNSLIVWIRRDLDLLPTDGRPLSQSQKLSEMYQKRQPLYEAFADITVDNNGTIEEAVDKIMAYMEESI